MEAEREGAAGVTLQERLLSELQEQHRCLPACECYRCVTASRDYWRRHAEQLEVYVADLRGRLIGLRGIAGRLRTGADEISEAGQF